MIGIKIGNNYLKLPAGFQLNWELLHPAFSDNLTGGGYTFPIDFDRCPENDVALQFAHSFHYDDDTQYVYNITIEFNGSFWKEGKLYIDRPGTKKLGGYLRTGIETFDILDLKLSQIDYGGDILMGTDTASVKFFVETLILGSVDRGQWFTDGYNFPTIYSPDFYGDKNTDFKYFINNFNYTTLTLLANAANAPSPSNVNCIIPMPYYLFLFTKIFATQGYSLYRDDTLFLDIKIDQRMLFSNYALDQLGEPHYRVKAGKIGSPSTYGDGSSLMIINNDSGAYGFYDADNVWDTTNSRYHVAVEGAHQIQVSFPFFTATLLHGGHDASVTIECYLDASLLFSFRRTGGSLSNNGSFIITGSQSVPMLAADIGKYITFKVVGFGIGSSSAITEGLAWIKIDALENSQVNIFKTTLNIKNHVPDKTVREFLEDVKNELQISYHVNEGRKEIKLVRNLTALNAASSDITDKADPEHEATPNTERIKLIGYAWPSDDALINDNFKDFDRGADLGSFAGLASFPTAVTPGQTVRDSYSNIRYVAAIDAGSVDILWKYLRDDFDDFIFDVTAQQEYRINICPMFMYWDTTLALYFPQIKQQGSSDVFGLGITPASPRSFQYAFGPVNYGNALCVDTRFVLNGTNPIEMLYRHYEWIRLRNTRFIWEKAINYNMPDIDQLYMATGGIMQPKKIDNMEFIVKKVSISMSDTIHDCKLELIRKP